MVYFSGYLIEATGSWASVFGIITVVNLLGLATFLSFAEARRVDIDLAKGRYHNIHIWEHRGQERALTETFLKRDVLNSHWFLHYGSSETVYYLFDFSLAEENLGDLL